MVATFSELYFLVGYGSYMHATPRKCCDFMAYIWVPMDKRIQEGKGFAKSHVQHDNLNDPFVQ